METICRNICNRRACSVCCMFAVCLGTIIMLNHEAQLTLPKVARTSNLQESEISLKDVIEISVRKMMPYYKNKFWCEALISKGDNNSFPDAFKRMWPVLINKVRHIKVEVEGFVADDWREALAYSRLTNKSFIKTICETGFNAGHSAIIWLTCNPNAHVYFFDLGEHPYSKAMSEFIQEHFPGRTNFTWGDSRKTIKEFVQKHPDIKCDLIHIDGGHTYEVAKADMRNMRHMAKKEGHVLLLDDHPASSFPGVGKAWREELQHGQVEEHWGCQFQSALNKGFTVAKFKDLGTN